MGFKTSDVVFFTQARANLSKLARQVKAGAEKIITRNGESHVALIDSDRLDYYHRLERERIHLLLIDGARREESARPGRQARLNRGTGSSCFKTPQAALWAGRGPCSGSSRLL